MRFRVRYAIDAWAFLGGVLIALKVGHVTHASWWAIAGWFFLVPPGLYAILVFWALYIDRDMHL